MGDVVDMNARLRRKNGACHRFVMLDEFEKEPSDLVWITEPGGAKPHHETVVTLSLDALYPLADRGLGLTLDQAERLARALLSTVAQIRRGSP